MFTRNFAFFVTNSKSYCAKNS